MNDDENVIPIRLGAMPRQDVELSTCYVTIESGPDAGKRFGPLPEFTTIGQEGWADIGLSDPEASRQECELRLTRRGVRVCDLTGKGVRSNDMRVIEAEFKDRARLTIGSTTLLVQFEPGARTGPTRTSDPSGTLLGASEAMRRLYHKMERVAPLELHVTIRGPNGTETTDVAHAMHLMSKRPGELLVADCSRVPAEHLESFLFGSAGGALDNAGRDRAGLFESARGGSVLLYQLGPMSASSQARLLSALEGNPVRRTGSDRDVEVKFRAFFTHGERLRAELSTGRFRQDLYDRMTDVVIEVPSLRERKDDLETLAYRAQHRAAGMLREAGFDTRVRRLSDCAVSSLKQHSWPGELTELDQVMLGALMLAQSSAIEREDLFFRPWALARVQALESDVRLAHQAPALVEEAIDELDDVLRPFFLRLFQRTQGDVVKAALVLRLPRSFVSLMKQRYWDGT